MLDSPIKVSLTYDNTIKRDNAGLSLILGNLLKIASQDASGIVADNINLSSPSLQEYDKIKISIVVEGLQDNSEDTPELVFCIGEDFGDYSNDNTSKVSVYINEKGELIFDNNCEKCSKNKAYQLSLFGLADSINLLGGKNE